MPARIARRAALVLAAAAPVALPRAVAAQDDAAAEALVRRFFAEVLSSDGDLAALDALMDPTFPAQNPADVSGRDAYKQRRASQREALGILYDSWAYEIADLLAVGGRVAARVQFRGDPSLGGDEVRADALAWIEVEDGRIARIWIEQDTAAIARG